MPPLRSRSFFVRCALALAALRAARQLALREKKPRLGIDGSR
jgi:hypothetical protein